MRDSFKIQILEATTSISPVARFGLTALGAARDLALHRDHILRPYFLGALVNRRFQVLVKDSLRHAIAVAQVDENHAAMVAAPVDPAHQHHGLAGVGSPQFPAILRSSEFTQKIQCDRCFHIDIFLAPWDSLAVVAESARRSPRAPDSPVGRMTCSSERSGRRPSRLRPRSERSALPTCWPVPSGASAGLRRVPRRAHARYSRAIRAACRCTAPAQRRHKRSSGVELSNFSSTVITRRSSPIEKPIPGAGTLDPSDSANPSYRPPPSTEFCAPSAPCTTSNVVRM